MNTETQLSVAFTSLKPHFRKVLVILEIQYNRAKEKNIYILTHIVI